MVAAIPLALQSPNGETEMETEKTESNLYDGIIINHKQRSLFFAYLGIKLKLPKIILESSVLTAIIALILILGVPTAMVAVPVTAGVLGSVLGFFGIAGTAFSLAAFTPIILSAAGVLVAGTVIIAGTNSPKLSFKTAQNVIMEELTKYLFLPAFVLIKKNAANFAKSENELLGIVRKQMTDIGYTEDYVRVFFNRYENQSVSELEAVLSTLNNSSDKLMKKKHGTGKLYKSDFKPVLYVDKAIALCNEINAKHCDEVAKQKENEATIKQIKALLSADRPPLIEKTKEKISKLKDALVKKQIFTIQQADDYALALFVEPLVWFLRCPNMRQYYEQIFTRKMKNLGYDNKIQKLIATYSVMKPIDIFQSVKDRNDFMRSRNIKADVLNKLVLYHCEIESYIYVPRDTASKKEKTVEEKLLEKLKATMQGKETQG